MSEKTDKPSRKKWWIGVLLVLIAQGCDKPSVDMWEAARTGDMKVVEYYLVQGAYKDAMDANGNTLLDHLKTHGPRAAGVLWEYHDHFDVSSWCHYILELMSQIKTEADTIVFVDSFRDVNVRDFSGNTPLHCAVEPTCVLAYYPMIVGRTPSAGPNLIMIKRLLEKGADVNAKTNRGRIPLREAVFFDSVECVRLLIKNGADVNDNSFYGKETLLHDAVVFSGQEILRLLIDSGANINAKNDNGHTPLHYACEREKKERVRLLIDKGADINARNNEGKKPHDLIPHRQDEDKYGPWIKKVPVQKEGTP